MSLAPRRTGPYRETNLGWSGACVSAHRADVRPAVRLPRSAVAPRMGSVEDIRTTGRVAFITQTRVLRDQTGSLVCPDMRPGPVENRRRFLFSRSEGCLLRRTCGSGWMCLPCEVSYLGCRHRLVLLYFPSSLDSLSGPIVMFSFSGLCCFHF